MSVFVFTNNAASTLNAALAIGGTSITLPTGEGTLFASPASGERQVITLLDYAGYIEICYVSNKTGDVLTIERGKDGTVAREWPTGTFIEARLTKVVMDNIAQLDGTQTFAGDVNTQNLGVTGNISVSGTILTDGAVSSGVDDSLRGFFKAYGGGAGGNFGGTIQLFTAADWDTTINYYQINPFQDELHIGSIGGSGTAIIIDDIDTLFGGDVDIQGNFTSLGIDDNATSTQLTIDETLATFGGNLNISNSSFIPWSTGQSIIQIGGNGAISATTSKGAGRPLYLSQNVYRDGADWKHISTDEGALYTLANGNHVFATMPTGGADSVGIFSTILKLWDTKLAEFEGAVTVKGAFTSLGIDDNAVSTAITIDSNNRVGIQTTPHVDWSFVPLQIGFRTALWDATSTHLTNNLYHDGTNYRHIATGLATHINMSSAGAITFSTGSSQIADAVASLTNSLTLDSSFNAAFGGDVTLADNKFLYLGDSNDLRFSHQTSFSAMDNVTGALSVRELVNSGLISLQSYNSVGSLKDGVKIGGAIPNVGLYYDGNLAVQTHSGRGLAFGEDTSFAIYRNTGSDPFIVFDTSDYMQYNRTSNYFQMTIGGSAHMRIAAPSAGETSLYLYDADNAALERVTVGAADSGGTGYKVLRILN